MSFSGHTGSTFSLCLWWKTAHQLIRRKSMRQPLKNISPYQSNFCLVLRIFMLQVKQDWSLLNFTNEFVYASLGMWSVWVTRHCLRVQSSLTSLSTSWYNQSQNHALSQFQYFSPSSSQIILQNKKDSPKFAIIAWIFSTCLNFGNCKHMQFRAQKLYTCTIIARNNCRWDWALRD